MEMESGRIVNVNELVKQPTLRRHMGRDGRGTVTFAGVVAAGEKCDAAFTRQVRLRLRYFACDESVGTGCNGGFKIALRPATAPCYFFNSSLRTIDKRYRPI
jgi:hypothetical protein